MNKSKGRTDGLLSTGAVAEILSLSKRTVHRLKASGRVPRPVKVGGAVRWRLSDIEKWIELGCPDQAEFEARKGAEACQQ